MPKPGGMMRYGIPEYRLPREVLDKEIEAIREAGVNILVDRRIESLEKMFDDGFDAVFIAIGMQEGLKLGIKGENLHEVVDGISFLRDVNLGKNIELGEKVAVIGGGNVAMDASRTALRFGAKEVSILYRRSYEEMPAYNEEIEQAMAEGVNIEYLVIPVNVSESNGKITLECQRMELAEIDESGRKRPVPAKGSEFSLELDNMLVAIGQRAEIPNGLRSITGKNGNLIVNTDTLATSINGVFAGGDIVSGASTVIDAIAIGKKAARSIDQFLGGDGVIERKFVERAKPEFGSNGINGLNLSRQMPIKKAAIDDNCGFNAMSGCYTEKQAIEEATRCLRCDLRFALSIPSMPPEKWIEINEKNMQTIPNTEGVLQLFDGDKNLLCIKGTMNLAMELEDLSGRLEKASYLIWEEETMYSKRESELLQQYMQNHGGLPEGNTTELDDDLY
ncbi:hypothetical protein DSCW_52380 [Desulfosarcina widdelii]|uniref:FAD/NAD(P)-binding domain-containing protein n=2 Tax=Desulfosarcina widdelii TaxID=947919 RepID=A0A5K7ZDM0_9BACT|nr:hypothetical protein DSCW_52380 [Desulfosarcina widdelii]